MASGRLGSANSSAPYETITTAHISLTIIDYPPVPVPTTFSLVPPEGQDDVVPTALAPSNIHLTANDSQDSVDERAPVAAFVPAGALSSGQCIDSLGNTNTTNSCQRRVQFLVYTSVLFFQQIQDMTQTIEDSANAGVAQQDTTMANSLIIGIKLGTQDRVQLAQPVILRFRPLSGTVSEEWHLLYSCHYSLLVNLFKFTIYNDIFHVCISKIQEVRVWLLVRCWFICFQDFWTQIRFIFLTFSSVALVYFFFFLQPSAQMCVSWDFTLNSKSSSSATLLSHQSTKLRPSLTVPIVSQLKDALYISVDFLRWQRGLVKRWLSA